MPPTKMPRKHTAIIVPVRLRIQDVWRVVAGKRLLVRIGAPAGTTIDSVEVAWEDKK